MAKDDPHFRLRIPAKLKDRIEDAARANERSINAEIVYALTQAYPDPVGMTNGKFLAVMLHLLESTDEATRQEAHEYIRYARDIIDKHPEWASQLMPDDENWPPGELEE